MNEMVVNPNKFQPIVINRLGKLDDSSKIKIDNYESASEISVTLLDIEIDHKLNFEKYVTALFQKAGCQLNALSWVPKRIEFQEMKTFLDSFIFSNSNYCPFVWYFCSAVLSQKK